MKRTIFKVLLTLFFFVLIVSICSAQNTARGIAAEKIVVEQKNEIMQTDPKLYFPTGVLSNFFDLLYTPNGRNIISINSEKSIVWDIDSGKEIGYIKGLRQFYGTTISPKGENLVTEEMNGLREVDLKTGKKKRIFEKSGYTLTHPIFSPNGLFLLTSAWPIGSEDSLSKTVILFNYLTGKEVGVLDGLFADSRIGYCYSPNGEFIATADLTCVTKWDAKSGAMIKKLLCFDDYSFVDDVDYSPDGKYIAVSYRDYHSNFVHLMILDSENGKRIQDIDLKFKGGGFLSVVYNLDGKHVLVDERFHVNTITGNVKDFDLGCVYSPNGKNIAVHRYGKKYNPIEIIDIESEKEIKSIGGRVSEVISIAINNKSKNIFVGRDRFGYFDKYVCLLDMFDLSSGMLKKQLETNCSKEETVFYTKDDENIIINNSLGISIYNVLSGNRIQDFEKRNDQSFNFIEYNPIKKIIAGIEENKGIVIWDVKTGKILDEIKGNFYSLKFSENGDNLLYLSGHKVMIYNILNKKSNEKCNFAENFISELSPGGKFLIAKKRENNSLFIIDTNTGNVIKEIDMLGKDIYYKTFSPDEKLILAECADEILLFNLETGNMVKKLECGTHTTVVSYSPDGKYIISGGKDGTIKVWNAETGSLIYTIVNGKNGDYLTYTPEGFFTGTEWAMKNLVHIVDGMDVIGIDQVYDKLYRPDLVAAKMRGEDISGYAKEVNLASIVRSGNAPAVAIENLPELSDDRDVTFDVCVQNTGGGIGNVSIVLNGKTIRLTEGVESSNGEQKIFRHTVTLQNGQNKIEAFAMNSAGMIESRRASANVNWQGKTSKPNLYVLTVAVNKYRDKDLWLNYCVPDAASIEESFKKQQSGLYQNVCVYSLKDAEVTKEGLEQKFKELSSIVTADDVFVFFVSGHGTAYDDGDYYFIPVNFRYTNKTDIPLKAISKSDLTKNLSLIKAGKTLMMLDTCNSGAFFADSNKRGMGDKGIFERLSRATGHAILAAASDSQSAMEGYNGHGVFTYVLLDGLAGNADSDGDGFVTLTELSSYVENQVPELSYEKWGYEQVPQKELRRQDFPIAEKLSD